MKLNKVIHNGVASYMQYKGSQPVRSMIGYDKSIPFYFQDLSGEANTLTIRSGVEYSTDNSTWSTLESGTLTIPAYGKMYIRYVGRNWMNAGIKCSGNFAIAGNLLSLFYGENFTNYNVVPTGTGNDNYQMASLFLNSTNLIDAKGVIFAKNVFNWGFQNMFKGCTNLVSAPDLSCITSMSFQSLEGMFRGCTSLVNPPKMPTIDITGAVYTDMFNGCTSLTKAPDLIANKFSGGGVFQGCTNLNYVKCLATNVSESGYSNWLNGVSATGTFVKKAGVTWPTGVNGIPEGWTVIEV